MKKGIIYVRVSTRKQANQGESLETQEKICKSFCEYNNIEVFKVFKEVFSGKKHSRPQLNKAIEYIKDNSIDYFIIFDIDRFSREGYDKYLNLKKLLNNNGVKLKDSKNIIGDDKIVINNDKVDMSQYKWNMENPNKYAELMSATQAEIEGRKILQRTIPREIELEQKGYHVRQPNYGYKNKKIKTDFGKATIQVEDPIEGKIVKYIFNERAKGIKTDIQIANELTSKGYKKRSGKNFNTKYIQELIKNPIYCGIIVSKWSGNKPIRAIYQGLVSIETWNSANKNKIKIIENKDGDINFIKGNNKIDTNIKKTNLTRNKFNNSFPFRGLIKSDILKDKLFTGGYSKGKGGLYGYYFPPRKKGIKGENIKKEIFEKNIYNFFKNIQFEKKYLKSLIDKTKKIYNIKEKCIEFDSNLLKEKLKILKKEKIYLEEKTLNNLEKEKVLKVIDKKLDKNEKETNIIKSSIDNLNIQKNIDKNNFLNFVEYIIEHIDILLLKSQNFNEIKLIFELIFKETPSYKNIVNRTPIINPLFSLNTKKKEFSKVENSYRNTKWQSH